MRGGSPWIVAVWVVAFAVLILDTAISLFNLDALEANDQAVTDSREVSRALADLLSSLKDAETGTRGYAITENADFLDPFRQSQEQASEHLNRLSDLAGGDPYYQSRIGPLRQSVKERLEILQSIVDLQQQRGGVAARASIRNGDGKEVMDDIREKVAEMQRHEEQILKQRSNNAQSGYWSSTVAAVIGGVLTIVMVGMAFILIRTELARRQKAEMDARHSADHLAKAQRETADSLALLETFLANAPIGMAFLDQELRYVRINEHLATANGRPVAQHVGRPLEKVLRNLPEKLADLKAVLATGRPMLNRVVAGRPGSSDRTWLSSYFPVRTGDGRTIGVGVVAQDITERQASENRLRESEARFRTLTEAIPQMVWNADAAGHITYFNSRWIEFTGLRPADAVGSWWAKIAHPDDAERIESAWHRAMTERTQSFAEEVRIRDAHDGLYRWFQTTVVPLRRADGAVDHWIGSLSSIDEQKRHSELLANMVKLRTKELETANELLREEIGERTRAEARAQAAAVEFARSNEDLEKFAYVASHDLQEPLRKIQAFGDRLTKKSAAELGPDGSDYVARMQAAATRMRTLINDLLAFSRVTTKAQPFGDTDLAVVVDEVLEDLDSRIEQTSAHIDVGELPRIQADPLQMRQLFQNLIGNALKFHRSDVAPLVTIRATSWDRLTPETDPPVPAGQGIRITVADNGIGFDQAYAERVFELFQRLHGRGSYEGTGIGLAICRKIAQRHGGSVQVRSREGEGSVFFIDLPMSAD